MAEKVKLADRKHPLYTDNSPKWDLYRDSVKGGDEFVNSANLFTHRLEDETDFTERLTRAYYLNYCDVVPNIYNNYIFKEQVNRPPDESLVYFLFLQNYINNVNFIISKLIKKNNNGIKQ